MAQLTWKYHLIKLQTLSEIADKRTLLRYAKDHFTMCYFANLE